MNRPGLVDAPNYAGEQIPREALQEHSPTLAHRGVLFLDEVALYRRDVLESLRVPLEEGTIRISRSAGTVRFSCAFSLVAAMNPCPCGYLNDALKECECSEQSRAAYLSRLSGPLLDRIDIQAGVERLSREDLLSEAVGESSAVVRERVECARRMQASRFGKVSLTNASVPAAMLRAATRLSPVAMTRLGDAIDRGQLSGRGTDRVLRVARTIADLASEESVSEEHVLRALLMRAGDRAKEVVS